MNKCDFVFSGIFNTVEGKKLVHHLDNIALKKTSGTCETTNIIIQLHADYTRDVNIIYIDRSDLTIKHILNRLPVCYHDKKIEDRYVIIMDTMRQMFHNYEKQNQFICQRSRRSKNRQTPTVISETTSVASQFSCLK